MTLLALASIAVLIGMNLILLALKKIGDFLGTGMTSILGIFGVYPQKNPIFGDGDGDRATKRFGDGLGTGII